MSKDPFMVDQNDLDQFYNENKPKASGEFCPRRDPAHDGRCFVCEYIQREVYDRKYHDEHPARKWASDKKAKQNMFFNVVFKDDPTKVIILEVGSKAGNIIWDGAKNKGWTDITHPKAGKGREMTISKNKGQGKWADYSALPSLEKADWDIPEEVYTEKLYDLSKIADMIKNGELTDDNYMRISSLKMGETSVFRICPPWNYKENSRWIGSTFRHWGVSIDQINGTEQLDWRSSLKENGTTEKKPDVQEFTDLPSKEKSQELPFEPDTPSEKRPACWGDARFMDEDDEECNPPKCNFLDTCRKEVKRKMKE